MEPNPDPLPRSTGITDWHTNVMEIGPYKGSIPYRLWLDGHHSIVLDLIDNGWLAIPESISTSIRDIVWKELRALAMVSDQDDYFLETE